MSLYRGRPGIRAARGDMQIDPAPGKPEASGIHAQEEHADHGTCRAVHVAAQEEFVVAT
ncbi:MULTISPECIES: hypothetical protein [unclassified Microbacterium]|uniref:hypothetical protein n=1 Tax=unclassified Microbacterium TaxID=2609290 RepID=UPI00214AEDFE|nr:MULTISPECIES: hypothetical protein [unclassified Microbacterium]MCR2801535.1 hypothetical protein [Microbacterium sp. zg.Y818]MCR2827305.1 hypothetical protein [Microbacterium sp. zg.Y909]WIM23187.1 hypothetical protein QNO21_03885 [Microbacterium sp. zg-Y818]